MSKKQTIENLAPTLLDAPLPSLKVSSWALTQELNKVRFAVSENPIVPIIENFLFKLEPDKLTIISTNLLQVIITEMPVVSTHTLSICVPARTLMDTLKMLEDQLLTVEFRMEDIAVFLVSNSGRYKIAGENAVDWPKMPTINNLYERIIFQSEHLLEMVDSSVYAVSKDDLRPAMTGIFIEIQSDGVSFTATDGHRLSHIKREGVSAKNEGKFILPSKAAHIIKGLLPKGQTVRMEYDSQRVRFEFGKTQVITSLLDEKFPDYANAVPNESDTYATINRMDLLGSLKRIGGFSDENKECRIDLESDKVIVSSSDKGGIHTGREKIPLSDLKGDQLSIGFNFRFLSDALASFSEDDLVLRFTNNGRPIILEPTNQKENVFQLALVMPMVITNTQQSSL